MEALKKLVDLLMDEDCSVLLKELHIDEGSSSLSATPIWTVMFIGEDAVGTTVDFEARRVSLTDAVEQVITRIRNWA